MKRKINLSAVIAITCISFVPLAISDTIGFTQKSNPTESLAAVKHSSVTAPESSYIHIDQSYGQLPLSFELNQGQVDDSVKFISRGRGYSLFLTPTESILVLKKPAPPGIQLDKNISQKTTETLDIKTTTQNVTKSVLRMKLTGANTAPKVTGLEQLPGKVNYFIGKDPKKWHTNISTYAKVRYENVYPGVDLVYYGNHGRQLEYDFIVAPGTDPMTINLGIEGADKVEIDVQGNLVLQTGDEQVHLNKPLIYQETQGARQEVPGGFVLKDKHNVAFHVANYDAGRPLIIDPVLVFSTYLGGNANDGIIDIAVDAENNVIVTGSTTSDIPLPPFPPPTPFTITDTQSPFQHERAGDYDIFVAKLNADFSALLSWTYLGGTGRDVPTSMAVDSVGDIYLTGKTASSDFPFTPGAYDEAYNGGISGGPFVAKLNSSMAVLEYATFIGGISGEESSGIAVDSFGKAYIVGSTRSIDFPVTFGAFDETCSDGDPNSVFYTCEDAFVTKFNATGSALEYSTFLGGTEGDYGFDIAVNAAGNAYVTGGTVSIDFPTINAFDNTLDNEPDSLRHDAFIAKLDTTGSTLEFSTFLGGLYYEHGEALALDAVGNIYVTGRTESYLFPTTSGAFDTTKDGLTSVFVSKFNATASSLEFSTYLEGGRWDYVSDIAVNDQGIVSVTGKTTSVGFPTKNPLQPAFGGGWSDGFVSIFNSSGSELEYSSYLGGNGNEDGGNAITVDIMGNIYAAGFTESSDFPTVSPLQPSLDGVSDGFVVKLILNQLPIANAGSNQGLVCTSLSGTSVTLDGSGSSDPDDDSLTYTWTGSFSEGGGTVTGVNPIVTLPTGASNINLVVNDGLQDSEPDTVTITITCDRPIADAGLDQDHVCASLHGTTVTLDGSASYDPDAGPSLLTYNWTAILPEDSGTVTLTGVSPTVSLPMGVSTITLIVNDGVQDSDLVPPVLITITCTSLQHLGLIIDEVNTLVADGVLSQGHVNALTRKLEDAKNHLNRGKPHQATKKLEDFISQVNAKMQAGALSPEQGQFLIDAANDVIASLSS